MTSENVTAGVFKPNVDRASIEAVIREHCHALKVGDIGAMTNIWEHTATVIDGFAPFIWSGPGALHAWWSQAQALLKPAGIDTIETDLKGWQRFSIQGDHAFVVAAATAWLLSPAMSLKATGTTSFILHRTDANWRIVSWSWAGGEPAPAQRT